MINKKFFTTFGLKMIGKKIKLKGKFYKTEAIR